MLAKQHQVGVGGKVFTLSGFLAMALVTDLLPMMVCFFGFGPPLLTVFNQLHLLATFFL